MHEDQSVTCDTWHMKSFFQSIGISFDGDYLFVPGYAESVKIDVGLSVNAPQSSIWLKRDIGLFVFGFEPLLDNIERIKSGESEWPENLAPDLIGQRIAIVPCALSSKTELAGRDFFVTKNDPGCSSLLAPVSMEVLKVERVPVVTLDSFLDYFPFERFPIIEHVKIDVQGADFEVIKGSEAHLDKIMFVTLEIDTFHYTGSTQSEAEIKKYMKAKGFIFISNSLLGRIHRFLKGIKVILETDDPTFLNFKLYSDNSKPQKSVYQRG
jgi:FkbM family methyltransferase